MAISEDDIENALQAMSETAGSWEERCHAIMAALGADFGGFNKDVPEVGSWYEVNIARHKETIRRLEDENAELRRQLMEK